MYIYIYILCRSPDIAPPCQKSKCNEIVSKYRKHQELFEMLVMICMNIYIYIYQNCRLVRNNVKKVDEAPIGLARAPRAASCFNHKNNGNNIMFSNITQYNIT